VMVGLQLLFFLTPIIYPPSAIPTQYRLWLVLNPFSSVIQGYRDMVLGRPPVLGTLVYPAVCGIALLVFGYAFLKANEYRVADLV
jgi:ABC-type polysaccharide/polyol phosphate export permease